MDIGTGFSRNTVLHKFLSDLFCCVHSSRLHMDYYFQCKQFGHVHSLHHLSKIVALAREIFAIDFENALC